MKHILESENFTISLAPQFFQADINLPVNTKLSIEVKSDGFTAQTTMDIDIKSLAQFANDLNYIYKNLTVEARLEEPYGSYMGIAFKGDGRGHINIKGCLEKTNPSGVQQVLEFENRIDQTDLRVFCSDLKVHYEKYLQKSI